MITRLLSPLLNQNTSSLDGSFPIRTSMFLFQLHPRPALFTSHFDSSPLCSWNGTLWELYVGGLVAALVAHLLLFHRRWMRKVDGAGWMAVIDRWINCAVISCYCFCVRLGAWLRVLLTQRVRVLIISAYSSFHAIHSLPAPKQQLLY